MSREFLSKLDKTLERSHGPKKVIATDRLTVLRAGIDSEEKLLEVASSRRASPRTLAVVGWVLARWPGASRRTSFLHAVERLLSHPSPEVRSEAAVSLGLFRLKGAVPMLVRALGDGEDDVKVRAIAGLGLHGDVSTLPLLVRTLEERHESAEVRAAAAEALGGFDALHAKSALAAALHDPSPDVRASAAHSLGELRVRSAAKLLRTLAEADPNMSVRDAARAALRALNRR